MKLRLRFRGGRNWQVEEEGRALPLGYFGRAKGKALLFIRDMWRWQWKGADPKARPTSVDRKYSPD